MFSFSAQSLVNGIKSYLKSPGNWIFIIFLAYLAYQKLPTVFSQYEKENSSVASFSFNFSNLATNSNQNFTSHQNPKNYSLVFWATWCGPCTVELNRINDLIIEGKIQPDQVYAISSFEDPELVINESKKRNYKMNIAFDPTGEISQLFNVTGTPTIVFIDSNHKIQWMTTGLSPLLSFRLNKFLNSN